MPFQLGITGNIGSGKTTVCKIFEVLGIPIYYADERARQLMTEDAGLVREIRNLLGEDAYYENGNLNRKYIASKVFNNTDLLNQLNTLVHPAVAIDSLKWHNAQKDVPFTLKEAALLFEAGSYASLDKIIVVTAPRALRIQRVMQRDNVPLEAVEARMDKQWPEDKKRTLADFVIVNDGVHMLVPQVLACYDAILYAA